MIVEDSILWIKVLLHPVILHKLMNFNATLPAFLHATAQQCGFGCPVKFITSLAHVQHAYTMLLTTYEGSNIYTACSFGARHAMSSQQSQGAITGQRREEPLHEAHSPFMTQSQKDINKIKLRNYPSHCLEHVKPA